MNRQLSLCLVFQLLTLSTQILMINMIFNSLYMIIQYVHKERMHRITAPLEIRAATKKMEIGHSVSIAAVQLLMKQAFQ